MTWPLTAAELVERQIDSAEPRLVVPAGFAIERVDDPAATRFPMFATLDDAGRMYVAESSGEDLYAALATQSRNCRVRRLEDRDGDGRYEVASIFADGLVFPMGLAWHGGKLYVADPPDLVVYHDVDNDGRGDRREVILTGFGHQDNGSLHGLIVGPDGRLYMTMGAPDGYKLKRSDGSTVEGRSGALIRCELDGTRPEVVCRGFVNLVEVAFTPRGEAIGTVNWYQNVNQPGSLGMRDALVQLIPGGLYPYEPDVGTPQPKTGISLAPVGLYPAVALSGIERYQGPMFPRAMAGDYFTAQHNLRRVVRHVLEPAGSTFQSRDSDFVTTDDPDFHPADVLESADGSMLLVDTGSWYIQHCPTGAIRRSAATGGIYRITHQQASPLHDPWGLQIDWQAAAVEELCRHLADVRPAVSKRAQRALVGRGEAAVPALARLLGKENDRLAAQKAIWALAQINHETALAPLRVALDSADADVAATAARAMAMRRDRGAAEPLNRLLASDVAVLRLAAAEALAECGDAGSLAPLWTTLERESDRQTEHALIHAIHGLADSGALAQALDDASPRVQRAALVLLSQPPRPPESLTSAMVLERLSSSNAELRRTALTILAQHPEWAESLVATLSAWLCSPDLTADESEACRELVLAFQSDVKVQALVADAITNAERRFPDVRRTEVLESIADCGLAEIPVAWMDAVERLLDAAPPDIQQQAVQTVVTWSSPRLADALRRFAADERQAGALRVEAICAALTPRQALDANAFALLDAQLDVMADPLLRLRATEALGRAALSDIQLASLLARADDGAQVPPDLVLSALATRREAEVAAQSLDYLADSLRESWRPDEESLRRACASLPDELQARGEAVRELWANSADDRFARLASLEELLQGGDPERGKAVFRALNVGCAACHRVDDAGGDVGPDLTRIGAIRAPRDLLESIVYPSSTIAQGFEAFTIATADGRTAEGSIVRQNSQVLVIREASGAERRLGRAEIEHMERRGASLMPDGLAGMMTRREFQDLLAYLQALK